MPQVFSEHVVKLAHFSYNQNLSTKKFNIKNNQYMTQTKTLILENFSWQDLFHAKGLAQLDDSFLNKLKSAAPDLHGQLLEYRSNQQAFQPEAISELLINCSIILEDFLARLFAIEDALAKSQAKTISYNPISAFKKYFVLRRAKKELKKSADFPPFQQLHHWLNTELNRQPLTAIDDMELSVALLGTHYLNEAEKYKEQIEQLVAWSVQALATTEGQAIIKNWQSFRLPERMEHCNLVTPNKALQDKYDRLTFTKENWRLRDGFKLTDARMSQREVQGEVNYCIYCHDHDGDFCSKGFPQKKGDPTLGYKKNPLDVTLTGCPLEEKISEMNILKRDGHTLASLAMVMVDNPMCPATGHRICNDCMKACIYQKQDPVNIPQIETRVLIDVLDLPWGVEIYDLLTRWNPLRHKQFVAKPYCGRKVIIAGMGPAGFTLAHHLLQEGYAVVGFDGLKIEPLPEALIHEPIYCYQDLIESLDERSMSGFGGVAEYGITVRWDKNFLKLIYLSLMRRPHFQVFGSVRFGGTLTIEDAWDMGFDHFVVAVGAGLPRALNIPKSLAPGMRQANDFLMALQLGSAAKSSSLNSLQIRMPAIVIGGGLTGVDTATELQAYYIRQVEKVLHRYEILIKEKDEETIQQQLDIPSREILLEFINHGKLVRRERELAREENRKPNFIKLLREWGGVTIVYRRSIVESPAYINNHEELKKALEEGIYYLEGLEPTSVQLDEHGHARALVCQKRIRDQAQMWIATNDEVHLPARSILVATGTQPNTAYEFEHRGTFNRLNLQYQHYENESGKLAVAHGIAHCKEDHFGPFTSYHKEDYRVSLIGDTHPVFHGSVVKAIASGMRTYTKIVELLKNKVPDDGDYGVFRKRIADLFSANIKKIERKAHNVIELVIRAPLAAKHFKPGQFYRLQNYEASAISAQHTILLMEPLALVVAACDKNEATLTFNVIEDHSNPARLCATLKPGDAVSLMGPTGVRAKIPNEHETLLIIGNQSSFPFMRSFGTKLIECGNRVLLLVKANVNAIYCQEQLENASHAIVWLTSDGLIKTNRAGDIALMDDDVIAGLNAYAGNNVVDTIPLSDVDRIFVVGETDLLRQFQIARKVLLKDYFIKDPKVFGSVYGNMQCMLKGVCAQCLQWQIDPETGQRTKAVFACSWQDQPLEIIDIDHIDARIQQNQALEQFNHLWIDYLFQKTDIERI